MPAVPVYSTRFVAEAGFTGSAAFAVPAGYLVVVRDIDVVAFVGTGVTIEAGIGGSAVFWSLTLNPTITPFWGSWRGRQIINAGEQLVISTDAPADFAASGYLLSLP